MTSLLRNLLAVAFVLVSSSAFAAETTAQGRMILRQCDYAFDYMTEVALSYQNFALPWGTSVELHYGWGGSSWSPTNTTFDWANPQTVPAPATAPYTWGATVTTITATRSGTWQYSSIQFVWKVTMPNGYVFYEKGNGSTWGFYNAPLSSMTGAPCSNNSTFTGPPTPLTVTSVERW